MTDNSLQTRERILSIDAVRIIFAFGIMYLHYKQFAMNAGIQLGNFYLAYLVELFFLISGMMTYSRDRDVLRTTFIHYYGKKFARLMPMVPISYLALLIALIGYRFIYGSAFYYWDLREAISPWRVVLNMTGTEVGGIRP